jgi:hypothetical protein
MIEDDFVEEWLSSKRVDPTIQEQKNTSTSQKHDIVHAIVEVISLYMAQINLTPNPNEEAQ